MSECCSSFQLRHVRTARTVSVLPAAEGVLGRRMERGQAGICVGACARVGKQPCGGSPGLLCAKGTAQKTHSKD